MTNLSFRKNIFFIALAFCFCFSGSYAGRRDSLIAVFNSARNDTLKCFILNVLISEENDNAIWPKYNEKLLAVSKKNLNSTDKSLKTVYLKYYALALTNLGYLNNINGKSIDALSNYDQALVIQKSIGDKAGISATLTNIGYIYRLQGNIHKAIDYYFNSLKIYQEINDKAGMSVCYNNLGFVFELQEDFPKALEYYVKSERIAIEIKDSSGIALCCLNIAAIYNSYGDLPCRLTPVECKKNGKIKAIEYLQRSIEIYNKIEDPDGHANALNCLATIYDKYSDLFSENASAVSKNKALELYQNALAIRTRTNNSFGIATSNFCLSEFYLNNGKIDLAYKHAIASYEMGNKMGFPETMKDAALLLSKIYASQNNFNKAYQMHKIYHQMSDSISNAELKKSTFKKQLQIEFELQATKDSLDREIKAKEEKFRHEKEIANQRFLILAGFMGFGLMIAVAVIFIIAYRNKKKANILLASFNAEILQQKEEIETQRDEITKHRDEIEEQHAIVIEQKNHIEEIHQELTSSIRYAERIQKAVLPESESARAVLGEHFVLYRPKDIVSGDFYFVEKRNNMLLVAVADCTGHGVPGGFMSMLGISFLNEIISKKEIQSAAHVLDELRKCVINSLQQKGVAGEQQDGMDIGFCAINTETLEMQFAGANNPCYVISKCHQAILAAGESGIFSETAVTVDSCVKPVNSQNYNPEIIELKPDKQPIGIYANMKPFTNTKIQLNVGDIIYLFSDGYPDQFGGPFNKKFLAKNMKRLLLDNFNRNMDEQKQIAESTIINWIGSNEQTDDITLVGVRVSTS